ncbi:dCTP deaminase [Candidatus Micrarchaeota archaeon CG1_02_55_22]|nr:MAG: dCTP deaminase [Candidatus Micrarchaeota archaeon CG1_02_55_22]
MILSGNKLSQYLKQGKIKITPFEPKLVGACSIDFRLGPYFRVFHSHKQRVTVADKVDYKKYTKEVFAPKGILVKPGELVLGATIERLALDSRLCGFMQGRSSMARMGLAVHVSSSLVQPGVDNVQVLEIVNNSPYSLFLAPGLRICQIVFEETTSPACYSGKFSKQARP